jgi:hypothetical protein
MIEGREGIVGRILFCGRLTLSLQAGRKVEEPERSIDGFNRIKTFRQSLAEIL